MTGDRDEHLEYMLERCAFCRGEGCIGSVPCPACGGHGQVPVARPPTPCSCCGGFGVAGCCRCSTCGGTGWTGVKTPDT